MIARFILIGMFFLLVTGSASAQSDPDTNNDGCVDLSEIVVYVNIWKQGNMELKLIIIAVDRWKVGCGAPSLDVNHRFAFQGNTDQVEIIAIAVDSDKISSISIFVDNGLKKNCNTDQCSTLTLSYSMGTHTYYATAIDERGNTARDPQTGQKEFTVLPVQYVDDYSDVLVVSNSNSPISIQISDYFVSKRNIPSINVFSFGMPDKESITTDEFNVIREALEHYLINNNLENKINYIVTTKGVPLRVQDSWEQFSQNPASFENEIALILGHLSDSIRKDGRISNPYFNQKSRFSRAQYDIFLVTRLDGYEWAHIKSLIDRSGPDMFVSSNAKFVLDQDPERSGMNSNLAITADLLRAKGYEVLLEDTIVFIVEQTNVIGYASWGSNDHHAAYYTGPPETWGSPHNNWLPGAIAETFVSTSARTFDFPPVYGQSMIADMIREGVSGVKGYIWEPYLSAIALPSVLFDRYTDGYNLAESYYMASRYLSWMDVVIGDPKTSLKV